MRKILLLVILLTNAAFGMPITGPELIAPDVVDITRCMPESTPKSPKDLIHKSVTNLPKFTKFTEELYNFLEDVFDKNCKTLAKYLEKLNEKDEKLLNYENIAPDLSEKDRKKIAKILNDPDKGFKHYLRILKNLDLHLLGYVIDLHNMLNVKDKVTIIDLIHSIDLIQFATIELQKLFQILSYLSKAYKKINGYKAILNGMHRQLSFEIANMVNNLCVLTMDLRSSYLSLLSKGDCSDEQIAKALGIYFKKQQAIDAE